jgi:hypothetical protein
VLRRTRDVPAWQRRAWLPAHNFCETPMIAASVGHAFRFARRAAADVFG